MSFRSEAGRCVAEERRPPHGHRAPVPELRVEAAAAEAAYQAAWRRAELAVGQPGGPGRRLAAGPWVARPARPSCAPPLMGLGARSALGVGVGRSWRPRSSATLAKPLAWGPGASLALGLAPPGPAGGGGRGRGLGVSREALGRTRTS